MNNFYRAQLIIDGEPVEQHHDDNHGYRLHARFEHRQVDVVEHWVFHQLMHHPDAEYQIIYVTEVELDDED